MIVYGLYFVCVFGKASLLSTSVPSIWEPDQLLGSSYVSLFVTLIPMFVTMIAIAQPVYIQTQPDLTTKFCPDIIPENI